MKKADSTSPGQVPTANDESRPIAAIVLLCVALAGGYGIVHDQITARICPAYFTLDHPSLGLPSLFHNPNPTVLGLAWGVVATAPLATILGIGVACAARFGSWPKANWRQLLFPIILGFCAMGFAAALTGIWAFHRARSYGDRLSVAREYAVWRTHQASYAAGVIVAFGIIICLFLHRRRQARNIRKPHI